MRTLTISLPPQQAQRLQDAVDAGSYASNSEVVRDALRLWERREQFRALELDRLKAAYDRGNASGEAEPVDPQQFLAELNAQHAKRG